MSDRAEHKRKGKSRWRPPEALPALGPMAMPIYVAIWGVLLVAAAVCSSLSAYSGLEPARNPTWSAFGLNVGDGPRHPVVLEVVGREARANRVVPGDTVVAVDGRATPSGTGAALTAGKWMLGPDGADKTLTLRAENEPPRTVTLRRDPDEREQRWLDTGVSSFAYYAGIAALGWVGMMLLIVCAVLLFRQRRQPVPALLSLAFLAICAGGSVQGIGRPELVTPGQVATSLGWTGLMLAIMAMPDGRFPIRWTRRLALAALIYPISTEFWTPPYWLSMILALVLVLGSVAAMAFRYRGLPQGPERQQLRWAFLGFVTGGALLGAAVSLDLTAMAFAEGDPRWPIWRQMGTALLFTLAISAFALGLLVSLLRYRLYDADAVIGRSAGYAVLTLVLAGAFGVSAKLIEVFFETSFARDAGALPGAIGAGLVLTMIAPLHRRIGDWAERRFQKDILRLRRDLPAAVDDLRETASLGELLHETLGRVMRGTRAMRAAVVIDGRALAHRGDQGEHWPTEVPLAIAHHEVSVGTLLVGPRPDGTPVGKDEREALVEIADPVARAIRIVRAREGQHARHEARLSEIEALVHALSAERARSAGSR
jgi:hypothetical protein